MANDDAMRWVRRGILLHTARCWVAPATGAYRGCVNEGSLPQVLGRPKEAREEFEKVGLGRGGVGISRRKLVCERRRIEGVGGQMRYPSVSQIDGVRLGAFK